MLRTRLRTLSKRLQDLFLSGEWTVTIGGNLQSVTYLRFNATIVSDMHALSSRWIGPFETPQSHATSAHNIDKELPTREKALSYSTPPFPRRTTEGVSALSSTRRRQLSGARYVQ